TGKRRLATLLGRPGVHLGLDAVRRNLPRGDGATSTDLHKFHAVPLKAPKPESTNTLPLGAHLSAE
ncbi:MAG: hypothetical protein V3W06_09345, partial [Acidimicrobiia bacterium]